MDLLISQYEDYYNNNRNHNGDLRICFIEGFKEFMEDVKTILYIYKDKYYGIYKLKLNTPKQLFDKYAHLQAWGGSPGVEADYMGEFNDRKIFETVIFENLNNNNEHDIMIEINNEIIKFTFKDENAFDEFVNELKDCKFRNKQIMYGKTNIPIFFNNEGFRQ